MKNLCTLLALSALCLTFAACATAGSSGKEGTAVLPPVVEAVKETAKPVPKIITVKITRLMSRETKYPDGVVSGSLRNTYDEKGNILGGEEYNGNKILVSQKKYSPQANGKAEVVTLNAAGEILAKKIQEFAADKIIRETVLNPKGETQTIEEYTYDANGKKTGWSVKTSSGSRVSTNYLWENGNISQIDVVDASDVLIKRFVRTYGDGSLLSMEAEYDAAGVMINKILYFYDGKFLVRSERQNPAGGIISGTVYKNDGDGNPVEEKYLDRNGRLIEVINQNWQVFTYTIQE